MVIKIMEPPFHSISFLFDLFQTRLQTDSWRSVCDAMIAQLVEQLICTQQVMGSSPIRSSMSMWWNGIHNGLKIHR